MSFERNASFAAGSVAEWARTAPTTPIRSEFERNALCKLAASVLEVFCCITFSRTFSATMVIPVNCRSTTSENAISVFHPTDRRNRCGPQTTW